jgi:hypothetical protein
VMRVQPMARVNGQAVPKRHSSNLWPALGLYTPPDDMPTRKGTLRYEEGLLVI